jgi:hypothetical protein
MSSSSWRPFAWVGVLALVLGAVVWLVEGSAPPAVPRAPSSPPALRTAPPNTSAEAPAPQEEEDHLTSLSGRVTDAETHAGVAGAEVRTEGGAARTDGQGRFVLQVAARGARVTAQAPGYTPGQAPWPAEGPLELPLERVGMLTVAVRRAATPAPNAVVLLTPPEPPRAQNADEAGVTRFFPLEPGAYAVHARTADGAWAGTAEAAVARRQHVTVTVNLEAAARLTGLVVEADGRPAAGAQVWAETEDSVVLGAGTAQADGTFALVGLPPRDKARVLAVNQGRQGRGGWLDLHGRQDAGTITLGKGGQRIAGQVVDENQTPLEGVDVTLGPTFNDADAVWAAARTDADGRFEFADLPEATFDVTARQGGRSAGREGVKTGTTSLVLRLMGAARLVGRVVNAQGEPWTGPLVVRATPRTGYGPRNNGGRDAHAPAAGGPFTSADGRFSVGPVGPSTYDVEVTTQSGQVGRAEAQVDSAITDVGDIKVDAGGVVLGYVTNKRQGGPVAGADVSIGPRQDTTGASGRFRLEVAAGKHGLWVTHPGYFSRRVDVPVVAAGETVDVGEVALVPGSRREIEGRQGFGGVGATLRTDDKGNTVVDNLLPDSPAARAGLLKGDVLLSVDGEDMRGKSLQDAISNIRGEAGSNVWLRVQRGGQETSIPVRREAISMPGR